ncbi:MAG: GTP-binding protein EngB [Promethearchaeota archaeon]
MISAIGKRPILAILGRSNTGKSSICRLLAPSMKNKIKVGKKPGVTKNFLKIEKDNYDIVDFPGFGYMKTVSKKERERIQTGIVKYIEKNHEYIFLALEVINLPMFPQVFEKYREKSIPFDKELFDFLLEYSIPTIIIANKVDKLKKQDIQKYFDFLLEALEIQDNKEFQENNIILFSAKRGIGFYELKKKINHYLDLSKKEE